MIVGTAGHIDHGKTTLVRALTGVDTDRLKEEKARGITIELGFAYKRLAAQTVTGFIDVPGHERFIHTMLAGASGIDYALLVVAADDGIKPQTREHLAILNLLGIDRGIVALTKADLANGTRRADVSAEIDLLLAATSLAGAEVLPVSATTGEGIDLLSQRLAAAETATTAASSAGRFRLAIDRCFTLSGAGTVVTGTVLSGSVSVGEQVTVSPSGITGRVRSIHAQNQQVTQGFAGQRCAINLSGEAISKDAIGRGDMLVDSFLHAPVDRIDADLSILASEPKAVGEWFPARLHHASVEVGARIVPLEGKILPGETSRVQLVLDQPIAAAIGDRYILRDVSAQRTIGGGRFLDLRPPSRKRRTPERLQLLAAAGLVVARDALGAALEIAPYLVDLDQFARDRALSENELQSAIGATDAAVVDTGSERFALSEKQQIAFGETLESVLVTFHADNPDLQGIGRERLRLQVKPQFPAKAFLGALRQLQASGRIVLEGSFVRLPGHEVRLIDAEEALYQQIVPHLSAEERFRPPRVRDFAEMLGHDEKDIRRVLKLCARLGRVDQIRHDHFFLRDTTAEMVDIVRDVASTSEHGEFSAAVFRNRVNNGRKVAIEILEYFDRQGVTLRRGDIRRVNPHRLDLYAQSVSAAGQGRDSSPVGRPDFKSGWGSEAVLGGFDSHSLPPTGER